MHEHILALGQRAEIPTQRSRTGKAGWPLLDVSWGRECKLLPSLAHTTGSPAWRFPLGIPGVLPRGA